MLAAGLRSNAYEKASSVYNKYFHVSCTEAAVIALGWQAILKCLYSNILILSVALKIGRNILNLTIYSAWGTVMIKKHILLVFKSSVLVKWYVALFSNRQRFLRGHTVLFRWNFHCATVLRGKKIYATKDRWWLKLWRSKGTVMIVNSGPPYGKVKKFFTQWFIHQEYSVFIDYWVSIGYYGEKKLL